MLVVKGPIDKDLSKYCHTKGSCSPLPSCTESGFYCVLCIAYEPWQSPRRGSSFLGANSRPLSRNGRSEADPPPRSVNLARFQGCHLEPHPAPEQRQMEVQPQAPPLVRALLPERVPPQVKVPLQAEARPRAPARPAEVPLQGPVLVRPPAEVRVQQQVEVLAQVRARVPRQSAAAGVPSRPSVRRARRPQ